jgi:hypothetical protein
MSQLRGYWWVCANLSDKGRCGVLLLLLELPLPTRFGHAVPSLQKVANNALNLPFRAAYQGTRAAKHGKCAR